MKKSVILGILIFIIVTIGTAVNAASFKASVTPTTVTARPGEEITITFAVSDIDLGEDGMTTIEGKLEYDKTIFEAVEQANVTAQGSWTIKYNAENTDLNGKFLAMTPTGGVKTAQPIATIKLKVKSTAPSQTTTVSIKNIVSNDGDNLIEETDKNVTVTINGTSGSQEGSGSSGNLGPNTPGGQGGSSGQSGSGTGSSGQGTAGESGTSGAGQNGTGSSGTNGSSAGQNGSGTGSSSNNKNDSDTRPGNLPQTGTNEILVTAGIVTFLVIGIGSFIAYRKNKID